MSQKKGQQTIGCDVRSCAFWDKSFCGLDDIKVAPCQHVNNGVPEDETLCASFEKKSK
ncbi:MAG TPA: DUF1540 domain-containing protein [Syntrophomonadaceae bacterium]|nr:DUF1540 domain-containing protein [Syntrophomonadaceae bacterium]